jgi:hypothetical protein
LAALSLRTIFTQKYWSFSLLEAAKFGKKQAVTLRANEGEKIWTALIVFALGCGA